MAITGGKAWQYLVEHWKGVAIGTWRKGDGIEGSGSTWRDSQVLESSATDRSSSPLVELPDPRSHTSSSPAT